MSDQPTRTLPPDDATALPAAGTPDTNAVTVGLTNPPDASTPPSAPAGYELLEEVGSGGMGVVYRARELALNRHVALKILHTRYPTGGTAANRFVEEAQITGQLQHPGIPPVHQVGTLPDGRPFLAMKLIKGSTLEDLMAERATPSEDRGRFLAVFEQVCQAVGYAHDRKVIHRDLKPANVMVGNYAEVQVMDWGLAKTLTGERPAAGSPATEADETIGTEIRSLRDLDSHTQAGSILGTPAFMPPEQAGGEVAKVDERSDVFGLGALLCVILTGKPPYSAKDSEAVRLMAIRGQLAEARTRLDGCGAELELIALCQRCLAVDPAERPANAGEVAKVVAAFRAEAEERAKRAEIDRARAEVTAAEQRKRRKVQTALGLAFTALVILGGAFAWWADRQASQQRAADLRQQLQDEQRAAADRDRLARNAEAVAALLDQVEAALRDDDSVRAGVAQDQAEKRAADGGAEQLTSRIARYRIELAMLRDIDRIDDLRWSLVAINSKGPFASDEWPGAFARFGIIPDQTPPAEAARLINTSPIRERLLGSLDRWHRAARSPRSGLRAILRAADPDEYRTAVREAFAGPDRIEHRRNLAHQPEALRQPGWFAVFLGEWAPLTFPRGKAILIGALGRRPADFRALMALGHLAPANQTPTEREQWFRAALAIRPANVAAWINLARALGDKGELAEAMAAYEKAIEVDPTNAWTHASLGYALYARGDLGAAIEAYGHASRLQPNKSYWHSWIAYLLLRKGDAAAALPVAREAVRLDSNAVDARRNFAWALRETGDLDGAIAQYREAIRLNPNRTSLQNDLQQAERWRELLSRLPDVAAGRAKPVSSTEAVAFAELCMRSFQRRYLLAVRLYTEVIVANRNRASLHHYNGACAAVLAAAGKDTEMISFGVEEWGYLTDLAHGWLRTSLAHRAGLAKNPEDWPVSRRALNRWKADPDLTAVRDPAWLAAMPEADRKRWQAFWTDVDILLAVVSPPVAPPPREVKQ